MKALRRLLDRKISRRAKGAKGKIRAHRRVGAIRTGVEERKLLDRKVSKRTKGAKGKVGKGAKRKIGKGAKGSKRKSREGTTGNFE